MIKTITLLCVFLSWAAVALAQPVGAGLKIGAPLNDVIKTQNVPTFAAFTADASNYVLGPYVEVRLPFKMSIEADALYRKYDFNNAGIASSTSSWEFPIVVKHSFLPGPIKPYFEAGLSFSRLSQIQSFSINHLSNYGVVAGGGVQLNLLLLKISPEVRYTGWGFRNFDTLVQSRRNQFTFLVGIGF